MTRTHTTDDLSLLIGRDIILERELASGGEGKIYQIAGDPENVAKIFHKSTLEKAAKIDAMLTNPPRDIPREKFGHVSIAWPTARLLDTQAQCVGFVMPYINLQESFPLLKVYNPQDRLETNQAVTWEYLLRMARNLTSAVKELHRKGYIIGDLNESNVLVTDSALVTLVDCDSMQVPVKRRGKIQSFLFLLLEMSRILPLLRLWHLLPQPRVFYCTVGKPEYTPPELQGCNFSEVHREPQHDNFGLAILIFLMLMEGRHPFAGIWRGGGKTHTLLQNIQAGDFPYAGLRNVIPPRHALAFGILPPPVLRLMQQCFITRYRWPRTFWRPGAHTWNRALKKAEKHLVHCRTNSSHIYSDHLVYCPWCERMKLGFDPFPPIEPPVLRRPIFRVFFLRLLALLLFPLTIVLYVEGFRFLFPFSRYLGPLPTPLYWSIVVLLVSLPVIICLILFKKFWHAKL